MQDAQIELIQDIIDTQSTTSTLYKGLTRLKNQLKNGWMSYFIDTFVKGKVYEQVVGKVSGKINGWIMGDWTSYYSAVTAVVKVVNTVVFEWILGANYGAYRSALMLDTYASDLCDSVKNKALTFQSSGFTTKDIEKYELLFNAYIAMSEASLDACQGLAIHNPTYTEAYLNEQLKLYDNDNIYTDYLDDVKAYILSIPKENRIINDYGTWKISAKTTLRASSDIIEESFLYCLGDTFKSNIQIIGGIYEGELIIENDSTLTIIGDITEDIIIQKYSNENAPYICNDGMLTINGNIVGSLLVENNGKLDLNGNIDFSFGSYSGTHIYGRFIQDSDTSEIRLSGNYSSYIIYDDFYSDITAGILYFDGVEQQSAYALKAANISVENPKGIKYLSDVQLYGKFLLNGNPLDNTDYVTCVYGDLVLDDISDYKLVYLLQDQRLSDCSIKCDIICNAKLTVPKESSVIINGTIDNRYTINGKHRENSKGNIIINGELTITESVVGNITITNNGMLKIAKDIDMFTSSADYGYLTMNEEDAVMRIGGNIETRDCSYFKMTSGKIVFDGCEKQTISDVWEQIHTMPTVIIENQSEEGVIFEVPIKITTLFDHKGNNYTLLNNGNSSNFVDYDSDGLKDNVDPHPTIHENCINGHNYGDWSTVIDATPLATGIKHKLCTECGDEVTEETPMLEGLAFKGASLLLQDNLAINYKVDKALFENVGYANPYVVFEMNGKSTTVNSFTVDGDRYVFKFMNIAPQQMNDTIASTLYATFEGVEYASESKEYSVSEYCYSMLTLCTDDKYAEFRTLLVDLLHYGAKSQLYTDYKTDSLVDADLTEEQLLWGTVEDPDLETVLDTAYETVKDPTVQWKGAGLFLDDSVSLRFKLSAESIDGLTVKVKGETQEWTVFASEFVETTGGYYLYFDKLNAGQMSEKLYLTVYSGDVAVSNTVCYSIESYAYEKQSSSISNLADLVKAMMKYGDSAWNYVN